MRRMRPDIHRSWSDFSLFPYLDLKRVNYKGPTQDDAAKEGLEISDNVQRECHKLMTKFAPAA